MTWLVTGGAGYIGAHVVRAMTDAGHDVVVLDDLSTGFPQRIAGTPLVVGDVLDADLVAATMARHAVTGVVHLAAKKDAAESLRRPFHYYRQNVVGLRTVLAAAERAGVAAFLFSSSAAVYGQPATATVTEQAPTAPLSAYGATKLSGERMVAEAAARAGFGFAALRCFNVTGAASPDLDDRLGDNLLPSVFRQLARRRPPRVFGGDHPTPDGTCVRDFVHVADVASAHTAAAEALVAGRVGGLVANVGRGVGVSVRQLVDLVRVTSGLDQPWSEPVVEDRRPGDPAAVVGSVELIARELAWSAQRSVADMVASSWDGWRRRTAATTGC